MAQKCFVWVIFTKKTQGRDRHFLTNLYSKASHAWPRRFPVAFIPFNEAPFKKLQLI